jgi:hypothetical protein
MSSVFKSNGTPSKVKFNISGTATIVECGKNSMKKMRIKKKMMMKNVIVNMKKNWKKKRKVKK